MFTPGRLQDATPTIRGFVYQVQRTIQRWLDLQPDEQLVLECGEDIDHILAACDEDDRILEQVKCRAQNVTLRSPDALTCVANFVQHVVANPDLALRFLYTTTAQIGRETLPSPFDGAKGIEAWILCQQALEASTDPEPHLSQLRTALVEAKRPEKCSETTWDHLLSIAHDDGPITLVELIQRFEWSCAQECVEDLRDSLTARLARQDGDVSDPIVASQRYEQLFGRVLSVLATTDESILTAATLEATLAEPTLAIADRQRLDRLDGLISQHAERLDQLTEAVNRLGAAGMPAVLFGAEIAEIPDLDQSLVLPTPPPLVANVVTRDAEVERIANDTPRPFWLALYGSVGTGKSHIAQLIGRYLGGISIGATTRGLDQARATRALESFLTMPGPWIHIRDHDSPVIMIDDLPSVVTGSRLELALQLIARRCVDSGAILITTGQQLLPTTLIEAAAPHAKQEEAPRFSPDDARALLLAYGVRADLVDGNLAVIFTQACDGHPVLLSALARHLVSTDAEPAQALLDALRQVHRQATDLATMRAVMDTVEQSRCRELLYRLACATAPLSTEEIRGVARVDPALPAVGECLARLEGAWLRRTNDERLEVSPLVKPLRAELPADLSKRVLRRVGASLVERRRIGIDEFYQAVNAFLLGDSPMSAASILLLGYMDLSPARLGFDALGLMMYFPIGQPSGLLPAAEMPIRTAQAITAHVLGQDASGYIARLDELDASQADGLNLGRAQSAGMLIAAADRVPVTLATRAVLYLEHLDYASEELAGIDWPPRSLPRDVHIVLATRSIRSLADLEVFVDALLSLPERRRVEVMSSHEAIEYCSIAVLHQLFDDSKEVVVGADSLLRRIESRCVGQSLDAIGAMLVSARLVIYGEYEKDIAKVVAESYAAREVFGASSIPRAIIDARLGQQLLLADRPSDALPVLRSAVSTTTAFGALDLAMRLVDALAAAIAADERADDLASELSELLKTARATPGNPGRAMIALPSVRCQLHGQLAVYYWYAELNEDAYRQLELSLEQWSTLAPSDHQRCLGAVLAHTVTYYAHLLESDAPPPEAADGGPFVEPTIRFFASSGPELARGWRELTGPAVLRMQLGRMAAMLGLGDQAKRWMQEAFELSVEGGLPSLVSMTGPAAAIEAVCAEDWDSAIDQCLIHGRARIYCERLHADGIDSIGEDIQYGPRAPALDAAEEERAESHARWILSRAVGIAVCRLVSEDHGRVEKVAHALSTVLMHAADSLRQRDEWNEFGQALETCVTEAPDSDEVKRLLGSERDDLRFVAHSLTAFQPDAGLKQAAASQIGLVSAVCSLQIVFSTARQEVFAAVSEYWDGAISRARFAFGLPGNLERALQDAKGYPPAKRAASVLLAVTASLDMRLSDADKQLLDSLVQADGRIPKQPWTRAN